jgi:hypothetical protein
VGFIIKFARIKVNLIKKEIDLFVCVKLKCIKLNVKLKVNI